MEGSVKFYNIKKGFGFIKGDDDKDYFVHFSALEKGVRLRTDDRVSFDAAEGDRGLKADNVRLLKMASELTDEERANAPSAQAENNSNHDSTEEEAEEETQEE